MSQRSLLSIASLGAFFAAFLSGIVPGAGAAEPNDGTATAPTAGDVEAARQHFRQGLKYYDIGRYLDAAHEYEAAFVIKDDAALLFNIGQAYRFAGENAKAIGAYKAYLRRNPKTPMRVELEARIADLQKLVAAQQQMQKAPPGDVASVGEDKSGEEPKLEERPAKLAEPPPPREPIGETPQNRLRRYLGLGAIGGGGALVIVGATLTGLAYALQAAQSHPSAGTAYDPSALGRIRGEQAAGGVLLGVGAGAIAGGTVLYLLARRNQHRERIVATPLGGKGGAGLALFGVMP
jgi:tetratricopeptide (TPR) repeat protein